MANISSMRYQTDIQFYQAVAQAKQAQATRESVKTDALKQSASLSFEEMLKQSASSYDSTSISGSNTETAASTSSDSVSSSSVTASNVTSSNVIVGAEAMESYFQEASQTYGVSEDLLKAIAKHESNFTSNAVSSAGAIGVMQLMPSTAEYLGVSDPYDAEQNIMGGAKLISELSSRYNGDLDLTLAAYCSGIGTVAKYGGVPPYSSTQNYIKAIKETLGIS